MYMEIVPRVEKEKGAVKFPGKTEMESQRTW